MKHKIAFFSGFSLFVSFCILSAAGVLIQKLENKQFLGVIFIAEALACLLPAFFLRLVVSKPNTRVSLRIRRRIPSFSAVCFTVFSSLAVAVFGFLMNYTFLRVTSSNPDILSGFTEQAFTGGQEQALFFAILFIVSPICEELFLRGALFSSHEKILDTSVCIALSGICFAMLHGNLQNFIGPLLAGVLYAYLTYSFDCLWTAMLAHSIYNLYYIGIQWLTETYSAFGVWKYIPGIGIILFFGFFYLALHSLETLLATNQIHRFQRPQKIGPSLLPTILNPGFLVFILAFLVKAVFQLY